VRSKTFFVNWENKIKSRRMKNEESGALSAVRAESNITNRMDRCQKHVTSININNINSITLKANNLISSLFRVRVVMTRIEF